MQVVVIRRLRLETELLFEFTGSIVRSRGTRRRTVSKVAAAMMNEACGLQVSER